MLNFIRDRFTTYSTDKLVDIQDWRVACIYRFLQLLILGFAVGYEIFYKCHHMKEVPITSYHRLTIQQPTMGCNPLHYKCYSNFTRMDRLPYCSQFEERGASSEIANVSRNLHQHGLRHTCVYRDGIEVAPSMPQQSFFFVPTRISTLKQERWCNPSRSNNWTCQGNRFHSIEAERTVYLAEIERFTIMISSTFRASMKGMFGKTVATGNLADVPANVLPQGGKEAIPIRNNSGRLPSLRMIDDGVVISLGDVVRLAETDLDQTFIASRKEPSARRFSGGVLEVTLDFSNSPRFYDFHGQGNVEVMITARFMPMLEYKLMSDKPTDVGRTIENVHGIFIVVQIDGSMKFYNTMHFLQVAMTIGGLYLFSKFLVDQIMVTGLLGNRYKILKQQPSSDYERPVESVPLVPHCFEMDNVQMDNIQRMLELFEVRLNNLDGFHADRTWRRSVLRSLEVSQGEISKL